MNKKLLVFALLFVSILLSSIFVSASVEATTPFCILAGPGITCELDRVIDEDNDGHVSFNVTIFNNLDYPITDVLLGFGAEPYIKYEKDIESKGKLNIKTSDYYNYIDEGGNLMYSVSESFKLVYKDVYGETKMSQGGLSSKIFDKTEKEEPQPGGYEVGDYLSKEIMKSMLRRAFIIVAGSFIVLLLIILLLKSKKFRKIQK